MSDELIRAYKIYFAVMGILLAIMLLVLVAVINVYY